LSDAYSGIEDMYLDSDCVIRGTVKRISYFEIDSTLIRKIDVQVKTCYKGDLAENTLISVLENDGYIRLKTLYEKVKKEYEEKGGSKEKEDAFLCSATYMTEKEESEMEDTLNRLKASEAP